MKAKGTGRRAPRQAADDGGGGDPFAFRFVVGGKFISAGKGMHGTRTRSDTELVVVSSGTLGIRVGAKSYAVGAGQFLLMPAGVEHGGTAPYPRDLSFYWLHMMPDAGKERRLPQFGTVARPDKAYFWCDALLAEQRVPDNEAICDRLLALLFCEIARPAPVAGGGASGAAAIATGGGIRKSGEILAAAARRRLRIDFRKSGCSTAMIAATLHCNPDYLGRVYRAMFCETVADTVENMRLAHCETLLRTTTLPVASIAYDAGYGDPAYFSRRFGRRHSMSPRAWRQAHTDAASHVNSV